MVPWCRRPALPGQDRAIAKAGQASDTAYPARVAHGGTAGVPAAFETPFHGVPVTAAPLTAAPPDTAPPDAGQNHTPPPDAAQNDTPPDAARDEAPPHAAQNDGPLIDAARLRQAIARLSRRLRRHQIAGLTPTQLAALYTVEQSGPLRLSDLAAAEGIAPSTLTRLVAVLEDRHYVQRCAVAGDARASKLAITPQGREVLERIRQESTTALAGSLALLRPEEIAALAAALPAIEQLADGDPRDLRSR